MYQRFGKRALDLVLSVVSIILLSPVFAITAAMIYLEDGKPIIFRQPRPGRREELFTIYKFRSMPNGTAAEPSHAAIALQPTRVGRVIRRLNVDELPQLFNIVRGDMSFVGPRPPLASQTILMKLRRASPAFHLRPGLTGLAQVNAFDGMSQERKAEYDRTYAERLSLITDLTIILRTFIYLFKPPPTY
jgi:O-antigen biosynthesis protein WbqP